MGALALVPLSAGATTMWWTTLGNGTNAEGHAQDDQWDNPANWTRDLGQGEHEHGTPGDSEQTFITTSDTIPELAPAVVSSWMTEENAAVSGHLYVGGWAATFDAEHGDPAGRSGVLEIRGGELLVGDHYLRLGMRGAHGTLDQSGGYLFVRRSISLGWSAPDSVGTLNLSGGEIDARINVGTHGTGFFNMSGGIAGARNCGGCSTFIGRGYEGPGQSTAPAVGVLNQSGGAYRTSNLHVGFLPGSSGIIALRGDRWNPVLEEGTLLASGRLVLGADGSGSLTQTGGTLETSRGFVLGENVGSMGRYTVSGGTVVQIGAGVQSTGPRGLTVGSAGMGHMTVIGDAADIRVGGIYQQNGQSMLTVRLGTTGRGVTPIEVSGSATFAAGAQLQVQREEDLALAVGDSFVVLTAAGGVVNHGLELSEPEAGSWLLEAGGQTVRVTYTGGDLDGDNVVDRNDNCTEMPNSDQLDSNLDGYGDRCDGDYDNSGIVGNRDFAMLRNVMGTAEGQSKYNPDMDCDGDRRISLADYRCFRAQYGGPPGPSRLGCAGTIPCAVQ